MVFRLPELAGDINPEGTDLGMSTNADPRALLEFILGKGVKGVADIVEQSQSPILAEAFFNFKIRHQKMLATDYLALVIEL